MYRVISQNGSELWSFRGEFKSRLKALRFAKTLALSNHVIVRRVGKEGTTLVWEGAGQDVFFPRRK